MSRYRLAAIVLSSIAMAASAHADTLNLTIADPNPWITNTKTVSVNYDYGTQQLTIQANGLITTNNTPYDVAPYDGPAYQDGILVTAKIDHSGNLVNDPSNGLSVSVIPTIGGVDQPLAILFHSGQATGFAYDNVLTELDLTFVQDSTPALVPAGSNIGLSLFLNSLGEFDFSNQDGFNFTREKVDIGALASTVPVPSAALAGPILLVPLAVRTLRRRDRRASSVA